MKRLFILLSLVAILNATEIGGKWTGTIDVRDTGSGTTITTPVQVQFEHRSTNISGKIGRAEDRDAVPIKNAKIDGSTVYFEAACGETDGAMKFVLTLNGDQMEGEMKGAVDSSDIVGKVKLARAKN